MSSILGNKIKLSIFGESHGVGIGAVIDGFPAGFRVDFDYINSQLKRRRPSNSSPSTSRIETDEYQVISGIFNGITTGAPICVQIANKNIKSSDYDKIKDIIRPSHSDYTAFVKYKGYNDYRGGGQFSGRLTAPLVFMGALCSSYLKDKYNIYIGSHIQKIYDIEDDVLSLAMLNYETYEKLRKKQFSTLSDEKAVLMQNSILRAKESLDSVGGIIEAFVLNMPAGIGEPLFDSIESRLSHMMFSIPAIKGIEFGEGFNLAGMYGSGANDEYYIENEKIQTYTNNNGGILGGISNGMPITFKVCVKPTPSIEKKQNTVDIRNMQNTTISIEGRHDPCIVPRAVPVVEGATAIVLMDFMLNDK